MNHGMYQVHLKVWWDDGTVEMVTLKPLYSEDKIPCEKAIARLIGKGQPIELDDGRWLNPTHIRFYSYNVWRYMWDWC